MNEEKFKKSLNSFLEEKTYIVAYRSNYDSAREFNKELINYIKQLQNNWNELKKWLIQLQKFKGINQQGFSWGVAQEVLDKMQELESDKDE